MEWVRGEDILVGLFVATNVEGVNVSNPKIEDVGAASSCRS